MKSCWICKHLTYFKSQANWSEVTPGYDASVFCEKNQISIFDFMDDNVKSRAIEIAEVCKDFEIPGPVV